MGRGQGGVNPTSGGGPRRGQPAKARPQVALPVASRDLVEGRLEDLPLDREAVTATGLRPVPRGLPANPDIEAVRADGGLSGSQASELIQLKKLANDIRHAYISVTADDVHAGVRRLLKLLPQFTAAYVTWLAEYGIVLK